METTKLTIEEKRAKNEKLANDKKAQSQLKKQLRKLGIL